MASNTRKSDGVAFGRKPAFSSLRKIDYFLSDDEKAFEIRFRTALAAGVGTPAFDGLKKTRAPVTSRVYSAVIPVTGREVETSIFVNGFGVTEPGTNTIVVLTANDQHSVTHLAGQKSDEGFTAALPYRGKSVTELRLNVVLVAERDAAHPDASALVAITDISTDAALSRKKKPAGKAAKKS